VYTGLVMEMLHIMQSRLDQMGAQKDNAADMMGNLISSILNVEYVSNVFKNQQGYVVFETPLRFRCYKMLECERADHLIHFFRFEDCFAASEDFVMSSSSFNILYELMVMGFKRQVAVLLLYMNNSSIEYLQVVMSSSMGELVIAMRRNMTKVNKLTQKPAALANLGFLARQVGTSMLCHQEQS
jgi:hypothetical protein